MSQRLLRVRELLKREIGTILSRDYAFDALVTINDVDVTPDLRKGHVFLGIIGADGGDEAIVARLNRERGSIQRRLAKRVVLKFTPKLSFKADGSVERGVRTLSILEELKEADEGLAEEQAEGIDGGEPSSDEENEGMGHQGGVE
ncbi:MAG: 30S ribosome-binding factor RbfA [Verrucomicrobiaceae bacterium]|nr:30S ribosome-binding factor RbfA [Verrucomicrobiaceae bacterium]